MNAIVTTPPRRKRQPDPRLKTPEVEAALREFYRGPTYRRGARIADLAARFSLTPGKLYKHAERLGLTHRRARPHPGDWTGPEDEILEECAHLGYQQIRKNLAAAGYRRTGHAIAQRMMALGLKVRDARLAEGRYGTTLLAEALGITPRTVRGYIERGLLGAITDLEGRVWITDKHIKDFAVRYPAHFPLSHADRHWLLPILTGDHRPKGDKE